MVVELLNQPLMHTNLHFSSLLFLMPSIYKFPYPPALTRPSHFQTHFSFVHLKPHNFFNSTKVHIPSRPYKPKLHKASSIMALWRLALVLATAIVMAGPAYAQISTPCNASMLSTLFTPCMNFLTDSSANGTSPTTECCGALKSLTSGGMDCLCLVVTASIPFKVPINRTLAISLPRACNMPGVPVQCKASGSPLPAPGPVALGPSPSPLLAPSAPSGFTPTPSPQASSDLPSPTSPPLAPQPDSTVPLLTPPSPSVDSGTPSTSTGSGRSALTPSSAMTSYNVSPSVLLIALGFVVFKYY